MNEGSRIITLGSRVRLRLASDERLVALVRADEPAAFEAIYERHAKELLGFCAYMLGSRHDAEDAVQATFTSAYRALRADKRAVTLRPWLFTIARNESLSLLRARRPTVELNGEPAPGADPAGKIEIREEVRDMLVSLRGLPERQRAALVLAELHGLSQVEIAAVLGVRPDQVKAYVYQARSNLISERQARDADCREIREELALARGAALLKGRLRRHVRTCAGCRTYAAGVNRQRQFLGALLPFTPPLALKYRVLEGVLGASAGDPVTYVGGAALAGSAVMSGSVATTAVEVAGGGVKALAAKVVAGVAALGASVGVGASVLGVTHHPSPVRAGVTSTAAAGSPLPLTASALAGRSADGVAAGTPSGAHAPGGSSPQRRSSSTGRLRSQSGSGGGAGATGGGRPHSSGGGAGAATPERGGGSSPGAPSEAQRQAREAHHPPKSSQSQSQEHSAHQGSGEHPPRNRAERRQLQEERETQRAQAKVQRELEHEEHQRSRTRAPRSEEEKEQARKRREERHQEREAQEEGEETTEGPPSEGE